VAQLDGEETGQTGGPGAGSAEEVKRQRVVVEGAARAADKGPMSCGAARTTLPTVPGISVDRGMRRVGGEQGELAALALQDVVPQGVGLGGEDVGDQRVDDDPGPLAQLASSCSGDHPA